MADVFLSYASEDRARAAKLAEALAARGWSVWWDRQIVIGETFDTAIERELEAARAVVVLWTQHSIGSEWVKNEAAHANERGVLVPAMLDAVKLPLEFRRRQTADLTGWDGERDHAGFAALCDGVAATLGGRPAERQDGPVPGSAPRASRRRWLVAGLAVVLLGAAIALLVRSPDPVGDAPAASTSLADLVAGTYDGRIIADSQGPSLSDVSITVTKVDNRTVRVTSDIRRIGTHDIELTRVGDSITAARGDSPFSVDLTSKPHQLTFNPGNSLAYAGTRRD